MVIQERIPPYVSYKTWQTLLETLKRFVPEKLDGSYFREALFSGSSAKKLRTTLLFLGLINYDNVPTPTLLRLTRVLQGTSQEEKSFVLRDIVTSAYSFLFNDDLNLERATSGQLTERFEKFGVKGNTLRQCLSFFLHIAQDADIKLSPHFSTRSKMGIGRKSDLLKTKEKKRNQTQQIQSNSLSNADIVDLSTLHPSLSGLIKDLVTNGKTWDEREKEKFKTAFVAVFDIAIPGKR